VYAKIYIWIHFKTNYNTRDYLKLFYSKPADVRAVEIITVSINSRAYLFFIALILFE